MAAPTRVNAVTTTASGTTAASADISAAAVGSWMLAVFTTDSNGVGTAPAGWTSLLPVGAQQATGTRRTAIAARIKQSGDATVSWNSAASAYKRLTVFHGLGSAPISSWIFGPIGVRAAGDVVSGQSVQAGSATTSVAPSVTAPADALVLSVLVEVSTAVGDPTVAGATVWLNSGDASPVIEQHTIAYATPAAGATGAVTGTYVPTQASNGMGVQIVIPTASAGPIERTANFALTAAVGGTATVPRRPGFASVAQMLATPGATWAHRGGSTNWPEMSEYAYDQAVLAGYGALEFSAHRTSDGVWIGSHDPSLNRTSQTSGLPNISAMTWAQVQTYMNSLTSAGTPRPYYRLDDFLDKYTPTHVCIVDPKNDVGRIAEFLAICDAHGGNTKIVVKFFGVGSGSTALADAAAAKGYQTWGYFYEADVADGDLAADQSHWSILGMEYGATQASWDAVLSYGKPVVGHIAASQANYDTAIAKGARMVQVANVASVTAVGASNISGSIPLMVALSAARTVDVARTAAIGLGVGLSAARTVNTARAADTALAVALGGTRAVDVARTASIELAIGLSATRGVDVVRSAGIVLGVTLGGVLETGTISRTADIVMALGLSATRAVNVDRVASFAMVVGLGASAVVGVGRTAALQLVLSFGGVLSGGPTVPVPELRTLTAIEIHHTLTEASPRRTLEDA
jgi:hypothetical protein